MADTTESPMAVKVEEHSRCVILTYFHGDIGSMVDAHFSRALSKVCKAKAPASKLKKARKSIKTEEIPSFQGSPTDTYAEAQVRPVAERLVAFNPAENPCSSWNAYPGRTGEGSITYSLSPDGLSVTGQQYSTSLLNLLHSERTDMAPIPSSSKAELLPNWAVPQAESAAAFEPGRRLDKTDLYWY